MKNKILGLVGISSFLFFATGFIGLAIINPQFIIEIDNLSLSSYNLDNMNGKLWINLMAYFGAGLSSTVFLIGILIQFKKSIHAQIGFAFLILTSLICTSFGFMSNNLKDVDTDKNLILLRTIFFYSSVLLASYL